MTVYGEEILNITRLNPNSNLSNPDSDGYKLIDNTIGWLLTEYVDSDFINQVFIKTAKGQYLDLLGRIHGVYRNKNETDDKYRERIQNLKTLVFSITGLKSIGCEIFDYVEEIDKQITSSNPLLSHKYLIYADSTNKNIVNRFVNNRVFEYLEDV